MLTTIESATLGRYKSLALPARLSRLRLEMEMEETAPSLPDAGHLTEKPLQIQPEQLHLIDPDKSVAMFHDMNVLVEWRILSASETGGEVGRARRKQAAKLAAIFQELKSQPAEYRVLGCVGYINQQDYIPPRLGTVFNIPQGILNSPMKKPFYSLYEYLSSQEFEDFQPSLGARFELARELARGFLQFHQLGWFHKNIRSHSIVFFPESEIVSTKYPFILGFAYARPSEAGISDQAKVEDELKLYQHPECQEKTEKGYKLRYDVFSIGLLLFEITKWRPLKTYFTRLQKRNIKMSLETFARTLVENEKDELEFRMGTHYATALLTCLYGTFGVQGEDLKDTRLKLAYFVKNLALCSA